MRDRELNYLKGVLSFDEVTKIAAEVEDQAKEC